MPSLPVHLPPNPDDKPGRSRPIFYFLATFAAVFLAAYLMMQWI